MQFLALGFVAFWNGELYRGIYENRQYKREEVVKRDLLLNLYQGIASDFYASGFYF